MVLVILLLTKMFHFLIYATLHFDLSGSAAEKKISDILKEESPTLFHVSDETVNKAFLTRSVSSGTTESDIPLCVCDF